MSDQDRETPQPAATTTTTADRETARDTTRDAIKDDKGKRKDGELPDPAIHVAPPAPFEPLFTLLTNKTTNATVHPRVQYIFSDDDDASSSSMLAAAQSSRAVIVDLAAAPDGCWAVSWAASLSAEFAVTASQLAAQQSHDGEGEADGGPGPLMLRVEGVEREPVAADEGPARDGMPESALAGDVEVLAEEFRRRMAVLRRVVGETERRRAACDEQQRERDGDNHNAGAGAGAGAGGGEEPAG